MIEYFIENIGFFLKVVIIHVVTYCVCGVVFFHINNYQEWIDKNKGLNWRKMDSLIFRLAPVIQIFRGVLFGIVLLLIKDAVIDTNFGFIKLFAILAILGLFNVYQPAPGSIEGFIYIKPEDDPPPKRKQIGAMFEILIQIFIFSVIVTTNWTELFN